MEPGLQNYEVDNMPVKHSPASKDDTHILNSKYSYVRTRVRMSEDTEAKMKQYKCHRQQIPRNK